MVPPGATAAPLSRPTEYASANDLESSLANRWGFEPTQAWREFLKLYKWEVPNVKLTATTSLEVGVREMKKVLGQPDASGAPGRAPDELRKYFKTVALHASSAVADNTRKCQLCMYANQLQPVGQAAEGRGAPGATLATASDIGVRRLREHLRQACSDFSSVAALDKTLYDDVRWAIRPGLMLGSIASLHAALADGSRTEDSRLLLQSWTAAMKVAVLTHSCFDEALISKLVEHAVVSSCTESVAYDARIGSDTATSRDIALRGTSDPLGDEADVGAVLLTAAGASDALEPQTVADGARRIARNPNLWTHLGAACVSTVTHFVDLIAKSPALLGEITSRCQTVAADAADVVFLGATGDHLLMNKDGMEKRTLRALSARVAVAPLASSMGIDIAADCAVPLVHFCAAATLPELDASPFGGTGGAAPSKWLCMSVDRATTLPVKVDKPAPTLLYLTQCPADSPSALRWAATFSCPSLAQEVLCASADVQCQVSTNQLCLAAAIDAPDLIVARVVRFLAGDVVREYIAVSTLETIQRPWSTLSSEQEHEPFLGVVLCDVPQLMNIGKSDVSSLCAASVLHSTVDRPSFALQELARPNHIDDPLQRAALAFYRVAMTATLQAHQRICSGGSRSGSLFQDCQWRTFYGCYGIERTDWTVQRKLKLKHYAGDRSAAIEDVLRVRDDPLATTCASCARALLCSIVDERELIFAGEPVELAVWIIDNTDNQQISMWISSTLDAERLSAFFGRQCAFCNGRYELSLAETQWLKITPAGSCDAAVLRQPRTGYIMLPQIGHDSGRNQKLDDPLEMLAYLLGIRGVAYPMYDANRALAVADQSPLLDGIPNTTRHERAHERVEFSSALPVYVTTSAPTVDKFPGLDGTPLAAMLPKSMASTLPSDEVHRVISRVCLGTTNKKLAVSAIALGMHAILTHKSLGIADLTVGELAANFFPDGVSQLRCDNDLPTLAARWLQGAPGSELGKAVGGMGLWIALMSEPRLRSRLFGKSTVAAVDAMRTLEFCSFVRYSLGALFIGEYLERPMAWCCDPLCRLPGVQILMHTELTATGRRVLGWLRVLSEFRALSDVRARAHAHDASQSATAKARAAFAHFLKDQLILKTGEDARLLRWSKSRGLDDTLMRVAFDLYANRAFNVASFVDPSAQGHESRMRKVTKMLHGNPKQHSGVAQDYATTFPCRFNRHMCELKLFGENEGGQLLLQLFTLHLSEHAGRFAMSRDVMCELLRQMSFLYEACADAKRASTREVGGTREESHTRTATGSRPARPNDWPWVLSFGSAAGPHAQYEVLYGVAAADIQDVSGPIVGEFATDLSAPPATVSGILMCNLRAKEARSDGCTPEVVALVWLQAFLHFLKLDVAHCSEWENWLMQQTPDTLETATQEGSASLSDYAWALASFVGRMADFVRGRCFSSSDETAQLVGQISVIRSANRKQDADGQSKQKKCGTAIVIDAEIEAARHKLLSTQPFNEASDQLMAIWDNAARLHSRWVEVDTMRRFWRMSSLGFSTVAKVEEPTSMTNGLLEAVSCASRSVQAGNKILKSIVHDRLMALTAFARDGDRGRDTSVIGKALVDPIKREVHRRRSITHAAMDQSVLKLKLDPDPGAGALEASQ